MLVKSSYVYAICRVDNKRFITINSEFKKHKIKGLKLIIPTVDVLRKTRGGKNHYDTVPLLFNYGFIRMKRAQAYNRPFLNDVCRKVTGIHSWVKSLEPMHRKRLKKRIDNAEDFDDFSKLAFVTKEEIDRLILLSKSNKIYSQEDITNLALGDYVTLRGYPYEGMEATVLEVNLNEKTVRVQLYPSEISTMIIELPFENVLYSIYDDFDADKVTAPNELVDLTNIPDEIEEVL